LCSIGSFWKITDYFIWSQCYDFKNIFAEKIAKQLAFFTQNKAKLCKILIITLVFEENANFFRRKLSKIVENYDYNIDPCLFPRKKLCINKFDKKLVGLHFQKLIWLPRFQRFGLLKECCLLTAVFETGF
jgi:hypothetical protein